MSQENTIDYAGEFYFILPQAGLNAANMLREIHSQKPIDRVFSRDPGYPAVETFCENHKIEYREIGSIYDILKRDNIDISKEHSRLAYISKNEDQDFIEDVADELSKRRFYVQTRKAHTL